MKTAFIFVIQVYLLVLVQCVGNQFQFHPYVKFLKIHNSKKSYASQDLKVEDLIVYKGSQHGKKESDKILRLPGQPKGPKFNQYSGYVTVDPKHGKALFYYFVESTHASSRKPLVLWLNGGTKAPHLAYMYVDVLFYVF